MEQKKLLFIFLITQGFLTVGHVYRTKSWERQQKIAQQLNGHYDQLMDNKEDYEQQLYAIKNNVKKYALNQLHMREMRSDQIRPLPA